MNKGEFLQFCKNKNYIETDLIIFSKAIDFAELKFSNQERVSGGLVITHNILVGKILAEIKSSPEVIIAGLLHGLLDFRKELHEEFGKEVLELILGVARIKEIKSKNKNLQAEAIKKILVTAMTDVRVIMIKLANELENFRNIENLRPEKQKIIAEEAIEIYAPLAYRLGSDKIRVDLENSAFKIINPQKYVQIENFLKASSEQREKYIADAIVIISNVLKGKVKFLSIKGRPKHIYSIYRKMTVKGASLEEQGDLLGVRIIADSEKDCYTILAILHEKLEPLQGRLKDYIANPKKNYYRSVHTGLLLPNDKIVEVQIRTLEMDEFAEEGLAAHWKYKGLKSDASFEKRMGWLKEILNLKSGGDSKEFLEMAKVDVFGDRIYCYTPKGDVKELPSNSTILDFAFMVHEQVGYKAVAGRVNGKFVPLRHELLKGDVVEILTNKKQRPSRTWLKIVKTANARQKIRKSLKDNANLPAIHYKTPRIIAGTEEVAYLVESKNFSNAVCTLAKCCNPIPGEEIVGIPTKRRVVSVHNQDCKQALKEVSRWTKVNWKDSFAQKLRFSIDAKERSGLLADLLNTIVTAGFDVKEAKAKPRGQEDMECSFLVAPRGLNALIEMIKRVRKLKGVRKIIFED